jgi:hypothetical protein
MKLNNYRLPVGSCHERFGAQIAHVEFESIGPVGGVERRGRRAGGNRNKCRRHLRFIRQDNGDPIIAANPDFVQ